MSRRAGILLALAVAVTGVSSCRFISSILHEEEVVARVGNEFLYKSEVARLIPPGVSEEDSLRLAMQYINTWASDAVFLDIAQQKLSKTQKDVSKELESYRRSLLKYRYEQLYINERLDTAVSQVEINDYYAAHSEDFILDRPIVKARLLRIFADSPNLEIIRKKMSSDFADDIMEADSIAYSSADLFTVYSDKWVDIAALARDIGIDYAVMMPVQKESFVQSEDHYGKLSIAYIADVIPAGEIPPVDYCTEKITDIIISSRKHNLASSLEKELLEAAREKGKFVIY